MYKGCLRHTGKLCQKRKAFSPSFRLLFLCLVLCHGQRLHRTACDLRQISVRKLFVGAPGCIVRACLGTEYTRTVLAKRLARKCRAFSVFLHFFGKLIDLCDKRLIRKGLCGLIHAL